MLASKYDPLARLSFVSLAVTGLPKQFVVYCEWHHHSFAHLLYVTAMSRALSPRICCCPGRFLLCVHVVVESSTSQPVVRVCGGTVATRRPTSLLTPKL